MGKLKTKLQDLEMALCFGDKLRYFEKALASIEAILIPQDPWMIECERKDCITFTYEPGECMKNGLCYQFVCMNCLAPGKTVNYNLPHTLSHTLHTDLTHFGIF